MQLYNCLEFESHPFAQASNEASTTEMHCPIYWHWFWILLFRTWPPGIDREPVSWNQWRHGHSMLAFFWTFKGYIIYIGPKFPIVSLQTKKNNCSRLFLGKLVATWAKMLRFHRDVHGFSLWRQKMLPGTQCAVHRWRVNSWPPP